MAIRTSHFRVTNPESIQRVHHVPGVNGPVVKRLNLTLPIIVQDGFADADQATRAEIMQNKGDPSALVSVDALLHGTYNNCYKKDAQLDPQPTAGGGMIKYRITWEQIVPESS